ncbi:hypothetical protein HDU97_007976, partial [Phlyctochytrium planicorne]
YLTIPDIIGGDAASANDCNVIVSPKLGSPFIPSTQCNQFLSTVQSLLQDTNACPTVGQGSTQDVARQQLLTEAADLCRTAPQSNSSTRYVDISNDPFEKDNCGFGATITSSQQRNLTTAFLTAYNYCTKITPSDPCCKSDTNLFAAIQAQNPIPFIPSLNNDDRVSTCDVRFGKFPLPCGTLIGIIIGIVMMAFSVLVSYFIVARQPKTMAKQGKGKWRPETMFFGGGNGDNQNGGADSGSISTAEESRGYRTQDRNNGNGTFGRGTAGRGQQVQFGVGAPSGGGAEEDDFADPALKIQQRGHGTLPKGIYPPQQPQQQQLQYQNANYQQQQQQPPYQVQQQQQQQQQPPSPIHQQKQQYYNSMGRSHGANRQYAASHQQPQQHQQTPPQSPSTPSSQYQLPPISPQRPVLPSAPVPAPQPQQQQYQNFQQDPRSQPKADLARSASRGRDHQQPQGAEPLARSSSRGRDHQPQAGEPLARSASRGRDVQAPSSPRTTDQPRRAQTDLHPPRDRSRSRSRSNQNLRTSPQVQDYYEEAVQSSAPVQVERSVSLNQGHRREGSGGLRREASGSSRPPVPAKDYEY